MSSSLRVSTVRPPCRFPVVEGLSEWELEGVDGTWEAMFLGIMWQKEDQINLCSPTKTSRLERRRRRRGKLSDWKAFNAPLLPHFPNWQFVLLPDSCLIPPPSIITSRQVSWSAVSSLLMDSLQSSDSIGRRASLQRQTWISSSCGWESELEVSVRGLFIGVLGLARLFHLHAYFCFPIDKETT
jgi:hypothetical protein